MHEKYLVSVIIPVYNSSAYIQDMLSDVINQTYHAWSGLTICQLTLTQLIALQPQPHQLFISSIISSVRENSRLSFLIVSSSQ